MVGTRRQEDAMNFNNILIGSEDPRRLGDYYSKLFGKPAADEGEGGYLSWQLGGGTVTVGPHSEVHGQNAEPGRIIWNIESDDVQGDFARFRDAGAIVVREPYSFEGYPDMWIATLADPDGNYFQLMSPFDPTTMGEPSGS
jgi:predicted enzyme related to lactoylglutathione lyase